MRDADQESAEVVGSTRAAGADRAPGLHAGWVVAYSWLMAAAAILVLNQVHEGLHEHQELPPIVHWLRDASLAVPLAAIAVVVAALVVRSSLGRSATGPGRSIVAPFAWAVLAAFLFAVLTVPGNQLHGLLFGAEEEEVGWLEDALIDGSIALVVSLVGLVPAALIIGPPWRAVRPHTGLDQAPGSTLAASAGSSAFLATAGSTHAGGDR